MGGPPFFVRWFLCCCFATKRFAYWEQNCFWGLRKGVTVLCVVRCVGVSGRVVVLAWFCCAVSCRMKHVPTGYSG